MKREFIRLKNKKLTLILFYALIIGFCVVSVHISRNYAQPNNLYDFLAGRSTHEELEEYYEEVKARFEEIVGKPFEDCSYMELDPDDGEEYNRLLVFEYVLKYDPSPKDTILYSRTYTFFSKDVLGMASSYTAYFTIALLVISVIFTLYIFNSDFLMKKQVFLYVGNDRMKILRNKFLAYICVMSGIILMLALLSGIYILIFADKPSTVLIVAGSRVHAMSAFGAWISEILNMTILLIPYIIGFFFIGVIAKNIVLTALLCFGAYNLSYVLDDTKLDALFGTYPVSIVGYGHATIGRWLMYYAIELLCLLILGFIARFRFKKCSLI